MADWVCTRCGSLNTFDASSCTTCGTERAEGSIGAANAPASSGFEARPALASPAGTMTVPGFEPVLPMAAGDLFGGLLGGAVAAVIATGIWYAVVALSGWQIGFIAIGVGWLVAQGTLFGAGGRASIPLVASSAVFTLLALAVGEYLIIYHFVSQELGSIELLMPIEFMVEVVIASLQADPLTLLFWAIALFAAVSIPFRAMTGGRGA